MSEHIFPSASEPSSKGSRHPRYFDVSIVFIGLLMDNTSTTYVAVVDDDESVCRSFARLLRAAGMQAITYDSAESFLADRKHPQFSCLVLDIQLGD